LSENSSSNSTTTGTSTSGFPAACIAPTSSSISSHRAKVSWSTAATSNPAQSSSISVRGSSNAISPYRRRMYSFHLSSDSSGGCPCQQQHEDCVNDTGIYDHEELHWTWKWTTSWCYDKHQRLRKVIGCKVPLYAHVGNHGTRKG
jgi:hypothetical protein